MKMISKRPHTLGCVSYLNSKPLIEPLVGRNDIDIRFTVPSRLLELVENDVVSTALLSVVDYQSSTNNLLLVPAGMIGCNGPTLTVRIFSRVPPHQVRVLYADTDSHTSVVLAQIILREVFGSRPTVAPLPPESIQALNPEAMLLIGDKVVSAAPIQTEYPFQLDLGDQWKRHTGLPFVFAMWMMRADRIDRELAALLADAQRRGGAMTDALLDRYTADKSWPRELARRYFTEYLKYEVTPRSRAGLEQFFQLADRHGLLKIRRKCKYLNL